MIDHRSAWLAGAPLPEISIDIVSLLEGGSGTVDGETLARSPGRRRLQRESPQSVGNRLTRAEVVR